MLEEQNFFTASSNQRRSLDMGANIGITAAYAQRKGPHSLIWDYLGAPTLEKTAACVLPFFIFSKSEIRNARRSQSP
jgi:hypothetical protein